MSPLTNTQVTAPDGATGKLCTWISNLSEDSAPPEILERVKYLILDGIGCALVGAHLPWSEKAAKAVLDMESLGNATVFGWQTKISPVSAALINSSFIQGFELDDWHLDSPWHSSSILLPALLAAAEYLTSPLAGSGAAPVPGKSFILAYLVGLEVGPRVGNALRGRDMLTRGWHSGVVFGGPAAAAAVSKLMSLSSGATEDAVGIACTQGCGLMSAQFESEVKRMQHGFAARNGLFAALLARAGYVGIKQVLERPYGGYLSMFSAGTTKTPPYLIEEVTAGLGTIWQADGVRPKAYAAMAGTHGSVDCMRILQEQYPNLMENLDSIQSINLEMTEPQYHHGGWKARRPLTATGAQMSCAFVAATQLIDRKVTPEEFTTEKLDRDAIWKLVSKITCVQNDSIECQAAAVLFTDGTSLTVKVDKPKGFDPALSNEEIVEKWRTLFSGMSVLTLLRLFEVIHGKLNGELAADVGLAATRFLLYN
ncbi:2-methylcitrate dehydratase PrpD [Pleurostoma richardsiae]|uniref:2-methylcitrate dehydratase PrpD n=1 Tax=Pleurostoma richardsiae TaxID=41990 RepID=A0AA38REW9_9PEZI|nr:2-methylcitrate dehydratase PrpD [Pleurostoma richardsiae]